MLYRTLDDVNLRDKIVVLRADLNLPITGGDPADTTRIERLIPTVQDLRKQGAKIVLMSHFGRPQNGYEDRFSLKQIIPALENILRCQIVFQDIDPKEAETAGTGPNAIHEAAKNLSEKSILLIENLRFFEGEKKNDPKFAKYLACIGDVYINDAFSVAHRAHASTVGITQFLPSLAGRSMEKEIRMLGQLLETPITPLIAVVGGAKISTKLALLENLVKKFDTLILGGGMANSFLAAQGFDMQNSLVEQDMLPTAKRIMEQARAQNCEILLPIDGKMAPQFSADTSWQIAKIDQISKGYMMLDIGPETLRLIESCFAKAGMILWNGPLGAFECAPFAEGTVKAAQACAWQTIHRGVISVAGGGDTLAALQYAGCHKDFTWLSTAGGAFLEWLEGKELPGVVALQKNPDDIRI